VIVAADTVGDEVAIAKEGRVEALVGQRPFEMGDKAPSVMIDLIEGKKVEDPVITGLDECTRESATPAFKRAAHRALGSSAVAGSHEGKGSAWRLPFCFHLNFEIAHGF
jgi:hypothetical protein